MIKRLFKLIGDILKLGFDAIVAIVKYIIRLIKKTFRILGTVFK